jgi:hypothetical protein
VLRHFSPDLDVPIASKPDVPVGATGVTEIDGGWRFESRARRVFTLFRFDARDLPRGLLIYRAETRSRDAGTSAYLELWCRAPGRGQYFAKGTHDIVRGYRRWRGTEIPFFLPSDGYVANVTLNLTFAEPGAVEMRNVELVWRKVPRPFEPAQLPRSAFLIAGGRSACWHWPPSTPCS